MNTESKTRIVSLIVAVVLVAVTACVDMPTEPEVSGKGAVRDTTAVEGDSTTCLRGYVVQNGRIVCN